MKVELTEEGYTLDGKWKLVPISPTYEMHENCVNKTTINLMGIYEAYVEKSPKPDLSGLQSVKGIHVGGELLPEFNLPEFNSDNGIHY